MVPILEAVSSIIASLVVTFGVLWLFYPAWAALIADPLAWDVEELSSLDNEPIEPPTLSLVIPAYNEQDRIPVMIREAFEYLTSEKGKSLLVSLKSSTEKNSNLGNNPLTSKNQERKRSEPRVEWIIVNDGSSDSTCASVRDTYEKLMENKNSTIETSKNGDNPSCSYFAFDWRWRIVSLKRNAGKGGAVKTGMNLSEGLFHLMVDADAATTFGDGLENLARELRASTQENSDIGDSMSVPMTAIFGSRAHLEKESTVKRSFVRTILMKAFHFFVSLFVSTKIQDTQCGFKLFTKSASYAIFQNLHLRRWAFDTEIVLLSEQVSINVLEVAVPWKEVDGSKLSTSKFALAMVSISMLRDMICVRACYTLGIWRIKRGH